MGKANKIIKNQPVEDDIDEITQEDIDNFGVGYIFKRALKLSDVHAEQRKLQQEKFDSHLKQLENDNNVLELRLTNQRNDFEKLNERLCNMQKQMVVLKTEKDILEMKLQAELKTTHRLNRDVENLQWAKNELFSMIYRSRNVEKLRQTLLSRRLF